MSRIIDITEKPKIKIKDKTFEVNDSAVTMLKILPSLEDLTPSKLYDFFELLFNEKDRKAIEKMNLNLEDFSQVIMSAVELVAGTVEDNEGETDEFKTMPWSEFVSLLSGLGPNTSLARLVEIRLEDDKDILKNFTPSQHRIRNQWRYRKTKEVTQEDVGTFLEQMKQTFISMSK